jgi:hypothetical protein
MEDTLVIIDALPSDKLSLNNVYAPVPKLVVPMVETESRPLGKFLGFIGRSGSDRIGRV